MPVACPDPQKPLPNFLMIGAPKAGTTSLWHMLKQHPGVDLIENPDLPERKETWFFSHYFEQYGWDWYQAFFDAAQTYAARGEASTLYAACGTYPGVPERIATALPDVRLIYALRDPLEQIASMYLQLRKVSGRGVSHDFATAVRETPLLLDAADYWKQYQAYRAHFPADQILLLTFEDLTRHPQDTADRCLRFVGLKPAPASTVDTTPQNVATSHAVDTRAAGTLRRLPGFGWAADHAPQPLARLAKRMLKRPITARPTWTPELCQYVEERIGDGTRQILGELGLPEDHWSFTPH